MKTTDCNLMVYMKTKENNTFKALSSLREFTFAPNLMYAILIPYEKLDRLKEWANEFKEVCEKENATLQIRSAKNRKEIIYQIN